MTILLEIITHLIWKLTNLIEKTYVSVFLIVYPCLSSVFHIIQSLPSCTETAFRKLEAAVAAVAAVVVNP